MQSVRIFDSIAGPAKGRALQSVQLSTLVAQRDDDQGDDACGDLPETKVGTLDDRAQVTSHLTIFLVYGARREIDTSAVPFSTTIDSDASVFRTTRHTPNTLETHHRRS